MHRRSPALLLLALASFACDTASPPTDAAIALDAPPIVRDAGTDAGPPADLDGFIEHHMRAGGIPGAAAAIIKDGAIRWIGTYGYADVESERPVDEHTLFILASISKTVAAARAMQLVEAGLLDLDAPVETYLGHAVRHPSFPDVPITTRMLLTHTSGLEDAWLRLGEVSTTGTDPTVSLAEFTEGYVVPGGAYYGESNWGAQPGTRRSYCNAAFGVIGAVLEAAGGASLREQTETAIFDVLDMDGAGWFLADLDLSRVATPYSWNGRRFSAYEQSGMAFYPAGSLRVSVTGLARFLLAIDGGGALDGARILSEESVAETLRIQFPRISSGQALTWSARRVAGQLYIGHSGSTSGGSTQMLLSAEGSHGIILLTNSDAYLLARFGLVAGDEAMEAILERLDEEARAL